MRKVIIIYYSKIIYYDTGNARGLSTVLFVSGCTHKCDGCFNKETWDFKNGNPYTEEVEESIIKSLKNPHISSLILSGGDPLNPKNRDTILNLAQRVQHETEVGIILYTGYTKEEIEQMSEFNRIKSYINIIVDGKFMKDKVSPVIDYRGSTNQKAWLINNDNFTDISQVYFKYNPPSLLS